MNPSQRIDKFLWFARLAKSRSLAAALCLDGQVLIEGIPVLKPHHPVRVGTEITLRLRQGERRVIVRELGTRRGPAPEAQRLYEETMPLTRPTPAPYIPLLGP
ncbi:MAG TPA: RNA-binding S4 domain-containing protein [Stellaceae bacterium]|nr:RNA-binding S4 domain-containing protein [Stellaceae bacterium]